MTCTLKESLKELERPQRQQIVVPLGVDETLVCFNSFILVPKVNGKVRVYLDAARLTTVLIRPVHRGPTLNDILPRLVGMEYLTLIDANSGYHNLKLEEKGIIFDNLVVHLAGISA